MHLFSLLVLLVAITAISAQQPIDVCVLRGIWSNGRQMPHASHPLFRTNSGHPAVVYFEQHDIPTTEYTLKYKRALDELGMAWPAAHSFSTSGDVLAAVLKVIDGRPSILCLDIRNTENKPQLKYRRAANVIGSSWLPRAIVDDFEVTVNNWQSTQIAMIELQTVPKVAFIMCWTVLQGIGSIPVLYARRGMSDDGSDWTAPQNLSHSVRDAPFPFGRTRFSLALVNNRPACVFTRKFPMSAIHMMTASDEYGDFSASSLVLIYESESTVWSVLSNPILLPLSGDQFAVLFIEDFTAADVLDVVRVVRGNCLPSNDCTNYTLADYHNPPGNITSLAAVTRDSPTDGVIIDFQYGFYAPTDNIIHNVYVNSFVLSTREVCVHKMYQDVPLAKGAIGRYPSMDTSPDATVIMAVWYGSEANTGALVFNRLAWSPAMCFAATPVTEPDIRTGSATTFDESKTTVSVFAPTSASLTTATNIQPTPATVIDGSTTTGAPTTAATNGVPSPTTPLQTTPGSIEDLTTPSGGDSGPTATLGAGIIDNGTMASDSPTSVFLYVGVGVVGCILLLLGIVIGACFMRRGSRKQQQADRRVRPATTGGGGDVRVAGSRVRRLASSHSRSRSRRRSGVPGFISNSDRGSASHSGQSRRSFANRIGMDHYGPAPPKPNERTYVAPMRRSVTSSRRSNQDTYVMPPPENYVQLRSRAPPSSSFYAEAPSRAYDTVPPQTTGAYDKLPVGSAYQPAPTSQNDGYV